MYFVVKEIEFSAAHTLRGHRGPCERLHGHNYRARVALAAAVLDPQGMVLDFTDFKRILREATAPLDHADLSGVPPFDTVNSTAENLARHIAAEVARRLPPGPRVHRVEVWETSTSCAIYDPDPEEVS
jgi:6-pyruvoyltetrahydropterin/6-carboxytetrahydropterin synthase